jgi:hypothetical protein
VKAGSYCGTAFTQLSKQQKLLTVGDQPVCRAIAR